MAFRDLFKRKKGTPPLTKATDPAPAASVPAVPETPMTLPRLPFPHVIIPPMTDAERMAVWKDADRTQGWPILIRMDHALLDMLAESATADGPLPDIEGFLEQAILEMTESEEGEAYRGAPGDTAPAMTAFQSFRDDHSGSAILANVPVEEPWQVFRHIPIGGWNACPDTETIMAFCKRMYERYGAVPAVVSDETLELVPARRPAAEEAVQLALELDAFCPDLIAQGPAYSVHALADCLARSDVWSFWWD